MTDLKNKTREIIELGSYPQSKVEDPVLAFKLTELAGKRPKASKSNMWTSYHYLESGSSEKDYMWYKDVEMDGVKYRGVYFIKNRPQYTDWDQNKYSPQESNGYMPTAVYWFKFEPLRWEVLEKNDRWAYIASQKIIDAQDYSHTTQGLEVAGAPNTWAESSLRRWLNVDFFDTAFSEEEKEKILLSEHAYRENSEKVNSSEKDRIFLLSFRDMHKVKYGYHWKEHTYDKKRQKFATDYAECQGIHHDPASAEYYSDKYQGQRDWWILDPVNKNGNRIVGKLGNAFIVLEEGSTATGVVPCMKISIGGYNGTAEDPDMLISRYIKEGQKCMKEGKNEEAYASMLKAAELGSEEAMYYVAGSLRFGTGVKEDKEEAIKWYKKVSEEGTDYAPYSMYQIGMIYYERNDRIFNPDSVPSQQNYTEAYRWMDMASRLGGVPDALYMRGYMLENGIGVKKDLEKAKESYELATYNGSEDAKARLDALNAD